VDAALADWRPRFALLHDEWRLRGRVPEGAFADVDRGRLEQQIQERIEGPGGLADFVRARQEATFAGPVLLGESTTPVGARTRFAALTLPLAGAESNGLAQSVRLVGTMPLVWYSDDAVDVLVLTNRTARRVSAKHLSVPVLEPLLFYLALLAGPERRPDTVAATEWLGERSFRVHATHRDGMVSFTYHPQDVSPAEARSYLTLLMKEFLDRSSFDLLPFDLIAEDETLRQAYESDADGPEAGAGYAAALREIYEEDQDDDFPVFWAMRLLEIVDARVPDDAYAKVRRRFRLLDRGPARARQQDAGRKRGH